MTIQNVGDYETGLEDFGVEDMVIPRLTIVHKEGLFKDSLTNETFDKVNMIILGLVRQRTLWHSTVDEGDWPMCRSHNFEHGIPNESEDQPRDKRFPWAKSGFNRDDFTPNENGNILLPCEGCALKEWKSHPDGKKPYCAEQYTLPILYDPRGDDTWVPAILTFQKTSLKPLKAYLTSFARSKSAAFQAITEVSLTMQKKGSNDYSVPTFKRVGDTDEENWREYSASYRQMSDFLTTEPGSRDEDEDVPAPSDNVAKAPSPSPSSGDKPEATKQDIVEAEIVPDEPVKEDLPAKAKSEPEPAPDDDDDELPF